MEENISALEIQLTNENNEGCEEEDNPKNCDDLDMLQQQHISFCELKSVGGLCYQ